MARTTLHEMLASLVIRLDGRQSDRGATATEYALLVGLIVIVIVAGVTLFGDGLNTWFSTMAAKLP